MPSARGDQSELFCESLRRTMEVSQLRPRGGCVEPDHDQGGRQLPRGEDARQEARLRRDYWGAGYVPIRWWEADSTHSGW